MGYAKEMMMLQQERGWSSVGDKYVCGSCFDDPDIQAFVLEHADRDKCDYCGAVSESGDAIAVHTDVMFGFLAEGIRFEWTDPINELPVEGGEYVFDFSSTDDLVDEIPIPIENGAFLQEFLEAFSDLAWVQRDFFALTEDDALATGWADFVRQVSHRTRFFFGAAPDDHYGDIPVADVLERIGQTIDKVGLVTELPLETPIFRARVHKPIDIPSDAKGLGTAPDDKAAQNRMSPVGIPLFYGAFDSATAIAEACAADESENPVSVGTFITNKPLHVIDLVDIPAPSGYWNIEGRPRIRPLTFLRAFAHEVAKPVVHDGREHLEYVPTQIVTEYMRFLFETFGGVRPDGILYRSAQNGGGVCLVLFVTRDECADLGSPNAAAAKVLLDPESVQHLAR